MSALAAAAGRRWAIPGVDLSGLRYELPALLALRWGRNPRRAAVLIVAAVLCLGVLVPLVAAVVVPRNDDRITTVLLLLPTAWTFFLVSTLISAIASAGGRELLPRSQAVALPVSAATDAAGSLLMVPLNLAWIVQSVGLLSATAWLLAGSPLYMAPAMAVTLLWIVAASCLAQFAGWAAELARTYRYGETVLRLAALATAGAALVVVATHQTVRVLDQLPTAQFAIAAVLLAPVETSVTVVTMVVAAIGSFVGAVPLVAALARRPAPPVAAAETNPRPRWDIAGSDATWSRRLDRKLVMRAAPLRRGLSVLVVLPLAAAVLVPVPWLAITVMPALVASAAGLLYGVNAFALDGSGALWRDSLPQAPRLWLGIRIAVLMQICGACAVLVVVVASMRSGTVPTLAEVVAVGCAAVVAVCQVASRCARWSVKHPFAAPLRQARDAPGPPVALAGYSVSLSIATTLSAMLFSLTGRLGEPAIPLLLTIPFLASALWSFRRTLTAFESAGPRGLVTATVAGA